MFKFKIWIYKRLIHKIKLREWLDFGDIRSAIKKAAEEDRNDEVAKLICSYLSSAICSGDWEKIPWERVQNEFIFIANLHKLDKKYPILSYNPKEKGVSLNSSSWHTWANVLASQYNWTLEYIAKLDIEDGIGLIQEILYDEQIRKEWEWGLSDKSVTYDRHSKKAKFTPLNRPEWMPSEHQPRIPKKMKIDPKMMPSGIMVSWRDHAVH